MQVVIECGVLWTPDSVGGDRPRYVWNALFWATTQRVVAIPYGLFGTAYFSHLQWKIIKESRNDAYVCFCAEKQMPAAQTVAW